MSTEPLAAAASNASPSPSRAADAVHEPAWRGHGTAPVNLVLEGGAMRGQFTAGVLDFFMDQKLFCERVIGVSAGALCGYNYVAGEDGRTCYLNTKYCDDWRYLSMKSFVRTGNACGREFAFDEIPNRLEPFNYAAFDESPMELIAVSSDLVTGEADYHPSSTRWPTCPTSSPRRRCPLSAKSWTSTASCCSTAARATACPSCTPC